MRYDVLEKNVIDVMQEFQTKIGYSRTDMGLFYPLESLNRLLGTDHDKAEMLRELKRFSVASMETLCGTDASCDGEMFRINIPKEGVEQVHETVPVPPFLVDFLKKMGSDPKNIDDIASVFKKYAKDVVIKPIKGDDFDWLIYFPDGEPDEYRYCIKFEEGHATYHRFTEKDYEAFGF